MNDIAGWRRRIDEIDAHLVKLLNERARCAVEIGNIKVQKGMEIRNPAREKGIITNVCDLNEGPLADDAVRKVFESIIKVCRNLEKV